MLFFFKQKTAYEMRISDWSSDVCSSDLILAVTAALATASAPSMAQTKVTISQAFQSMLYLPFYVAIDKGFFKKEGIDVDKETAGSPPAALSAVLPSSAQFSIHGPDWTAIAAAKGADVGSIRNVVTGAAGCSDTTPPLQLHNIKTTEESRCGKK